MSNNYDNVKKEPPDKEYIFKVIKCPLKSVLKTHKYDVIQPIIEKTVIDMNELVILGYQFIKLYLLDKYNNKLELPTINKQFILDILKTIGSSKDNRGKQKTESY